MRYGIISDIHGNLEAFEVALWALSREKIDKFLCIGDIVGYGTDPHECIERTKELNAVTVYGNHDAACAGLADIKSFNDSAREAIIWTRDNLCGKDISFLQALDLVYSDGEFTLVHGTLDEPQKFHYMMDKKSALATFDLMETAVCFIGHTHIPGVFSYKDKNVTYSRKERIEPSREEKIIVNVGSVGQPRDGDPRLCYSVYDTDRNLIELKRLPYDVKKTQVKILNAGLPPFLARRLSEGI